jgi:hypothetical protein
VLRTLVAAGFSEADAADASFVLNSFVVGFVLDETMGEPGAEDNSGSQWHECESVIGTRPAGEAPLTVRRTAPA